MLFAIRAHVVIEHMFGILNSGRLAENALQSLDQGFANIAVPVGCPVVPRPAPDTVKWRNLKGLWANAALSEVTGPGSRQRQCGRNKEDKDGKGRKQLETQRPRESAQGMEH